MQNEKKLEEITRNLAGAPKDNLPVIENLTLQLQDERSLQGDAFKARARLRREEVNTSNLTYILEATQLINACEYRIQHLQQYLNAAMQPQEQSND